MTANELMNGDWVLVPILDRMEPDSIRFIQSREGTIVTNHGVERYISQCEPIPITPEILEKNGFRKLETYGTKKWVCNNLRLNVYSSDGTWRFCADTNRNENSVIYIRFVHELQQALRLCGIKKEITI